MRPLMAGDEQSPVKPAASHLRLEPLSAALVPALEAFHSRLEAQGGPPYRFGTRVDTQADAAPPSPMRMETWLAVDREHVRGGILVQHLWMDSATGRIPAVNIQLPLSEGTVDRRYAHVGPWLIRSVQRREPRVFAVGMGSMEQPLPQLLAALRWTVVLVPFFVHVHRPFRFLREMPMLRKGPARHVAAAAAYTGVGFMGVRSATGLRTLLRRGMRRVRRLDVRPLEDWGPWTTEMWERTRAANSLAVVRDEASLRVLYPPVGDRTRCYRVDHDGRAVGWFVLLTTRMQDSAYFGNLYVGTILDAHAIDGFARDVLAAARRTLYSLRVDLSLTNQLHATWQRACEENGYWRGTGNFLFAASPALLEAAGHEGDVLARVHLTRGDGDGRIHL
jgi:hypothetical protein